MPSSLKQADTLPIASRRRVTIGILAAALLLIGLGIFFKLRIANSLSSERDLLGHLPNEPAAVVALDFAALRRAGLMIERTGPVEADYRVFLNGTGFDYRRDLDLVVASLSTNGNYFIARGRFDWPKLRAYAERQGGSCYDQLCRAPGSTPQRRISFIPLSSNLIGLAVSTDDFAASRLAKPTQSVTSAIPNAPAWMSISGAALTSAGALPEGIRVSLSGLLDADRILITAGPGGKDIELKLEANCRSTDGARTLESQFRSAAASLKEAIHRLSASPANGAKNDQTLAGILASGAFTRDAKTVTGKWSISLSAIQDLMAGM